MRNIVLDTCILIHIARNSEIGSKCINAIKEYHPDPNLLISVVTKGEIKSFIAQTNWGDKKVNYLNTLLDVITPIDISKTDEVLLSAYSHIDAYSQGRAPDNSGVMLNDSARNMGKNDLWIAATAFALGCPLLTADKDFNHLDGTFIDVIRIK